MYIKISEDDLIEIKGESVIETCLGKCKKCILNRRTNMKYVSCPSDNTEVMVCWLVGWLVVLGFNS